MLMNIFSLPNFITFLITMAKYLARSKLREKRFVLAFNQAQECRPSVLAHRKQRKLDLCEFEVDLVYSVSSRPIKAEE